MHCYETEQQFFEVLDGRIRKSKIKKYNEACSPTKIVSLQWPPQAAIKIETAKSEK